MARLTTAAILNKKAQGEKISVLTAYDATFARLLDAAEVDMLLVGDSVAMVCAGHDTTLPATMDQMIYHCQAVVRGSRRAHIIGDMPFMSYQSSLARGMRNAGRLLKEGGCQSVKLEGGAAQAELTHRLVRAGIPVMGHIGLTPQSVHQMGGFKIQGREPGGAERLMQDAIALQDAGAYALVLEGIPAPIATSISAALRIPTIGIGAGAGCDGQVLVIYDLLGMDDSFQPKFVRRYAELGKHIGEAVRTYVGDVRAGTFPGPSESFGLQPADTKAPGLYSTPGVVPQASAPGEKR